jgi:hypothetical protein
MIAAETMRTMYLHYAFDSILPVSTRDDRNSLHGGMRDALSLDGDARQKRRFVSRAIGGVRQCALTEC